MQRRQTSSRPALSAIAPKASEPIDIPMNVQPPSSPFCSEVSPHDTGSSGRMRLMTYISMPSAQKPLP